MIWHDLRNEIAVPVRFITRKSKNLIEHQTENFRSPPEINWILACKKLTLIQIMIQTN